MTPENIQKLLDHIKHFEGFSATIYTCPAGFLTIGYGHNCESHGDVKKFEHRTITKTEAENLLLNDLAEARSACQTNIKFFFDLTEVQQAILIDMSFNMGIYNLLKFKKFLKFLNSQDLVNSFKEMKDSNWWSQVYRRASILAFWLLTGEFV